MGLFKRLHDLRRSARCSCMVTPARRRIYAERWSAESGSDNIGSFHEDKYEELQPYVGSDRLFRCFVDPDDPTRSVLFRELRWGLLGLLTIFALVFCLVGYGLMFAAVYGSRIVKTDDKRVQEHPQEPWRWDKDWADGRVPSGAKGTMIGAALFATIWNLISAPALFFVPSELADGNRWAWVALLFPAVGLVLAGWAVLAFLRWRKFGDATFELSTNPGVLGGYLEGRIDTSLRHALQEGVDLTLSCVRTVTSGSGDNRSTRREVVWQDTAMVPGGAIGTGPRGVAVPVRFAIPYDAGPGSDAEASPPISWHLEAEAEMPGVDFDVEFKVPVFKTDRSNPAFAAESAEDSASSTRDWAKELADAGIVSRTSPTGGRSFVLQRARQKGAALALTSFTVIWCGFIWMMVKLGAPMLFPIVFGLFALLLSWAAVDMWLTEIRVRIENGTLAFTRRQLGPGSTKTFARDEISDIRPTRGMQSGSKLYYRVELETTAGKKHAIATQLDNLRLAKRFITEITEQLTA